MGSTADARGAQLPSFGGYGAKTMASGVEDGGGGAGGVFQQGALDPQNRFRGPLVDSPSAEWSKLIQDMESVGDDL